MPSSTSLISRSCCIRIESFHSIQPIIDSSSRIVGMMGVEPLQQAISDGAKLVLAGRCSDSALFAAIPLMQGFPFGLACTPAKYRSVGR
jgi:hypothetical protein